MTWHRKGWRGRDAATDGPILQRRRQRIGTFMVGDRVSCGNLHTILNDINGASGTADHNDA